MRIECMQVHNYACKVFRINVISMHVHVPKRHITLDHSGIVNVHTIHIYVL